ncbi:MAG: hypothetical protein ACLUJG_03085, partial [Lawsonibacter sp.]
VAAERAGGRSRPGRGGRPPPTTHIPWRRCSTGPAGWADSAPCWRVERDKILRDSRELGAPMPEEDVVDARDDGECARRPVELIRQGRGQLLIKR